eukprot:763388-Hanusia_phi.AAC.7
MLPVLDPLVPVVFEELVEAPQAEHDQQYPRVRVGNRVVDALSQQKQRPRDQVEGEHVGLVRGSAAALVLRLASPLHAFVEVEGVEQQVNQPVDAVVELDIGQERHVKDALKQYGDQCEPNDGHLQQPEPGGFAADLLLLQQVAHILGDAADQVHADQAYDHIDPDRGVVPAEEDLVVDVEVEDIQPGVHDVTEADVVDVDLVVDPPVRVPGVPAALQGDAADIGVHKASVRRHHDLVEGEDPAPVLHDTEGCGAVVAVVRVPVARADDIPHVPQGDAGPGELCVVAVGPGQGQSRGDVGHERVGLVGDAHKVCGDRDQPANKR